LKIQEDKKDREKINGRDEAIIFGDKEENPRKF